MPKDPLDDPTPDLAARLRTGAVTAREIASACLDRIAAREPEIEAWAWLDPDRALREAEALDAKRLRGDALGPLHGLPVGVKDILDTADMPTENGTPIHRGRQPSADATLVARLRAAGALVMGKTVTSELAIYTAGPTRNPQDRARTPGGSSSGSAAAIAAGMVPLALATQTNGSTIRPASFCGIVGYKPSLGLLPRTGVLRQCFILDQPGLMARDVAGVALLADALAGEDEADELSFSPALSLVEVIKGLPSAPRLAFVAGPYWDRADGTTRSAFEKLAAGLAGVIRPIALPAAFHDAAALHKTLMTAGIAEAFGANYDRAKAEMSTVVTGIVEAGRAVSAVEFLAALTARDRLRDRFARLFAPFDAILTPATLGIAPRREAGTGDPIMATTWTLLGAPALSLPLLTGPGGLPLGVQFVGNLGEDARLLRAAAWLERHAPILTR